MNLKEKLETILQYKNDIKNSLINKGSDIDNSTPLSGYAEKIDNLPTDDLKIKLWEPDPLWWDIKSILQNDTNTGDYTYLNNYNKMIFLIDDSQDTLAIKLMSSTQSTFGRWHAVKTSDGQLYTTTSSTANLTHTWDKTQDKPSSEENVKTRYVIYYLNPETRNGEYPQHVGVMGLYDQMIYTIWAINMLTNDSGHWAYSNCPKLQAFEMLEGYCLTDSSNRVPFDLRPYYQDDYSLEPYEKSIKFIKYYGSSNSTHKSRLLTAINSQMKDRSCTGTSVLISELPNNSVVDLTGAFIWSVISNHNELMNTYFNSNSTNQS